MGLTPLMCEGQFQNMWLTDSTGQRLVSWMQTRDVLNVGKRKSRLCSQDSRGKRSLPEYRELLSHENLLDGP